MSVKWRSGSRQHLLFAAVFLLAVPLRAGAQSLDVLHTFSAATEGTGAGSPLVQASDGAFYGAACSGGAQNAGTLFRTTAAGAFTVPYSFLGTTDGACPKGLVQASDGSLYGTTASGGAFGGGTAFRLTLAGGFTVLHAFGEGTDARSPMAPLIQATDGLLYGTTQSGGVPNLGTVFRMTSSGEVTVLYAFPGGAAGASPRIALVQASDGQFYGGTSAGFGTLFRMTSSGILTTLPKSGAPSVIYAPSSPLVAGIDHNLYGATYYRLQSSPHSLTDCAVFFRVSPGGAFDVLSSPSGRCRSQSDSLGDPFTPPLYTIVARRDGTFFGTELTTGFNHFPPGPIGYTYSSSILEFTTGGQINVVRSLGASEGGQVIAPLIEPSNGQLYGVAAGGGGVYGGGTIFRLRYTPSAPDVLTVSAAGAQVRLAWTPVAGAVSYTIKRSTTSGAETTIASGLVGTEFVDTTAALGQTYYYTVTATNGFGESMASYEVSITPGRAIPGDFDGDGKTDIAVFRPSTGVWYIRQSSDAALAAITWGASTDMLVPGDYDGDGKIDAAVFRPATGAWFIRSSSTFSMSVITWGDSTDIPVPGDYDGDGQTDAAVFRPSTGMWYIRESRTFTLLAILWGLSTDAPVPGDYDGDGRTDVAVFRASTGMWYVRRSATGTMVASPLGSETDTPVAADYDGDGKADVGVFSPAAHAWHLVQSGPGTEATILWGDPLDVPVPGDYDGDGRADVTVFRSSTGVWYVRLSSTGEMVSGPWGDPTDVPVLQRP